MEKKTKSKGNAEVKEPLDGFGLFMQDLTKKINLEMRRKQGTKEKLPEMNDLNMKEKLSRMLGVLGPEEDCPTMSDKEMLLTQKQIIENLNCELKNRKNIEERKCAEISEQNDVIEKLKIQLKRFTEQESLKLIGETDEFQEDPRNLKRKLPDRDTRDRQPVSKKSLKLSKDEDNVKLSCENDSESQCLLTPIQPHKKLKLKRQKILSEEEYKKEIDDLRKKMKDQELQKEKEIQELENEKKMLRKQLDEEHLDKEKLFDNSNSIQKAIFKMSEICDKFDTEKPKRTGDNLSNSRESVHTLQLPEPAMIQNSKEISVDSPTVSKNTEKIHEKLSKEHQAIVESKDAEIEKLQDALKAIKEDMEKKDEANVKNIEGAIMEKSKFTAKNHSLESLVKSKEEEIAALNKKSEDFSRLQRLLAEKDVEIKKLEASNTELRGKVEELKESKNLQIDSEQMSTENERCRSEIRRLEGILVDKEKNISDLNRRLEDSGPKQDKPSVSIAETQTEESVDEELEKVKAELDLSKKKEKKLKKSLEEKLGKAKNKISSLETNLSAEQNISKNLNQKVTKSDNMLKNLAKKYVKLQKDEKFNADSIQISAKIIENLEKELLERNKIIEQCKQI